MALLSPHQMHHWESTLGIIEISCWSSIKHWLLIQGSKSVCFLLVTELPCVVGSADFYICCYNYTQNQVGYYIYCGFTPNIKLAYGFLNYFSIIMFFIWYIVFYKWNYYVVSKVFVLMLLSTFIYHCYRQITPSTVEILENTIFKLKQLSQ